MEWNFAKVLGLLLAMCENQQIDPSTVAAFNAPPPLPRSLSPSAHSGLSPGLGVASLALSDTHSNASTHSSAKLDNSGTLTMLIFSYCSCAHSMQAAGRCRPLAAPVEGALGQGGEAASNQVIRHR